MCRNTIPTDQFVAAQIDLLSRALCRTKPNIVLKHQKALIYYFCKRMTSALWAVGSD